MEEKIENIHRMKSLKINLFREKTDRISNYELLRLLCMFGIIYMHLTGPFRGIGGGTDAFILIENALFNTGVSVFVLISGYFGIKTSRKKAVNFWVILSFYFCFATVLIQYRVGDFDFLDLVAAAFPISHNKHWFLSSYFLILLTADFINSFCESLDDHRFTELLAILFVLLSVLPTITGINLTNDWGKGPLNMFFMYILGRYIKRTDSKVRKKVGITEAVKIMIVSLSVGYAINLVTTFQTGQYTADKSSDYSSFTIIAAVNIFWIFRCLPEFRSRIINILSKSVLAMCILNGTFIDLIYSIFNMGDYTGRWIFPLVVAVVDLIIMVCSICVRTVFNPITTFISAMINAFLDKVIHLIRNKVHEEV